MLGGLVVTFRDRRIGSACCVRRYSSRSAASSSIMSSDPTRDHVRYGDLLAAPLSFWFGCCSGLAMSGFEITHLVAGGAFVDHLLSPRVFGHGARYHLMKYLHLSEFSLAIILLFARPIFWRDRRILVAYGIISISAATIFAGFEGTSYNMFQDAAVFLAVAAGVMLHELRGCITSEAAANALAAKFTLSVAPLLLTQADPGQEPGGFCRANPSCGRLAGNRPPSRKVLLCYRAGQPFTLDPFNSRQLILAGKLDQNELIQPIAARAFGVVQLSGRYL